MKKSSGLQSKRDKATGCAAALILHFVVLYGLWSYHIIPPPSEALTVFVSYIQPAAPAKVAPTVTSKPLSARQETPRPIAPTAPQLPASPAQVSSPSEPIVYAPPAAKAVPATVSAPSVNASPQAAAAQPLSLKDELSASCTERTPPVYPKQSARLGEQGKTVLLVELDEQGRVTRTEVKVTSGFARLDEAAINAVKTWHCTPAKRNGVAVRSVAAQPFNFILKGR
jgi:protein TonB